MSLWFGPFIFLRPHFAIFANIECDLFSHMFGNVIHSQSPKSVEIYPLSSEERHWITQLPLIVPSGSDVALSIGAFRVLFFERAVRVFLIPYCSMRKIENLVAWCF